MIVEEYDAGLARWEVAVGATIVTVASDLSMELLDSGTLTFHSELGGPGTILIEVPLGDAAAFWHPYAHWSRATLPPDWRGRAATSLVRSTPMGCLYSHSGTTILGYALDETERHLELRYGVSEENTRFVTCIDLIDQPPGSTVRLKLVGGGTSTSVIRELRGWLEQSVAAPPAVTPDFARRPVYSTWYGFHHDLEESVLDAEVAIAADLGFGSLFVDFGWQQLSAGRRFEGCGDWRPDVRRFPDFSGFVERTHQRGLAVVAWVAPYLLGSRSSAFGELSKYAPHHDPVLDAHVLDPRHPEVRRHLVEVLTSLVTAHNLDGLKVDFLERSMAYADQPSAGDLDDVGTATLAFLSDLRLALANAGKPDILIEFRQPYVSPALRSVGNVVRAEDCPGDAIQNRISTLDARQSTSMTVHSDMMMWDPDLSVEAMVRHLHSSLFAVPQVSVRLREASPAQLAGLSEWLRLWRSLQRTLLDGELDLPQPHANYPVASARSADGSQAVIAVYEPNQVVRVPAARAVWVVNATASRDLWLSGPDGCDWVAQAVDVRGQASELGEVRGCGPHRLEVPESGHLVLTLQNPGGTSS